MAVGCGRILTIVLSDDKTTYTGTITGERPVLLKIKDGTILPIQNYQNGLSLAFAINFGEGSIVYLDFYMLRQGQVMFNKLLLGATYYSHFITLTNNTSTFYFTYQDISGNEINNLESLKTALTGKALLCTGHTDSDIAEYISGEGDNIVVGVVDKSDNSTSGITIDSYFTITDLVSPVR